MGKQLNTDRITAHERPTFGIEIDQILLYDSLRRNRTIRKAVDISNAVLRRDESADALLKASLSSEYFEVQREILSKWDFSGQKPKLMLGESIWKNYVAGLVLADENNYSLLAEKGERSTLLENILTRDLEIIADIFCMDWKEISLFFSDEKSCAALIPAEDGRLKSREVGKDNHKVALNRQIDAQSVSDVFPEQCTANADTLYDFYSRKGAGILSTCDAFTWEKGGLVSAEHFDPVSFEELIGYETQKEQLIENTKFLLKGRRGNNVLLFGDRGTGKSSSVKALIGRFADQKLKLISIKKNQLTELSEVFSLVENRGCKFILFVDDLSFEEDEIEYKSFKSIIEGGLSRQPNNLLIYVTTNRRHLIRETWKDRSSELGDIHQNDGIQERTSLAERFGLTLTYSTPNKQEYLDMIRGLAVLEGLVPQGTEKDEALKSLEQESLKWEVRHNGRSGRAARQFINIMKNKKEDID